MSYLTQPHDARLFPGPPGGGFLPFPDSPEYPRGSIIDPVRLFSRKTPPSEVPGAGPSFGEWLIRQFTAGQPTADMPFSRLERVCSNAGLLLCGAVHGRPEAFLQEPPGSGNGRREGAVVARRTADGFKASLADRTNTVLAWPWDHMATSLAWKASREGDVSEASLGTALTAIGVAYSLAHTDQLTAVIDLWQQVAAQLNTDSPAPDLRAMGRDMLTAFESGQGQLAS